MDGIEKKFLLLNKMSTKEILKLRIAPIKSELHQISSDIKKYLTNDEYSEQELFKFFNKYNSVSAHFHQIIISQTGGINSIIYFEVF